ncbi:MAG: hypothetical protein COT74_10155 [Bdellovibrionales bacterium CG10_big_fil_rev_8_21_14_0_10_45_34]|nr:MAG: hypothetical protein COT74_10155 [Bdellovibrionales bacterium CG10_big_fil_rev_8_21_14_0_10_45_34]
MCKWLILIVFSLSLGSQTHAEVQIPTGLLENEQLEVLDLLGSQLGHRWAGDPFGLGAFPGVNASFQVTQVPIQKLNDLGDRNTSNEGRQLIPRLVVAKGLYANIDAFLHFTPLFESIGYAEYGGALRIPIHEEDSTPYIFSVIAHVNSINVRNLLFAINLGLRLQVGYRIGQLGIWAGTGILRTHGRFEGGTSSVTHNLTRSDQNIERTEYLGGLSYIAWDNFEFGLEASATSALCLTFQAGYRF